MGRLPHHHPGPQGHPEAVAHTQELFYLADLYRTPVILYGDYVIAHTSVGIEVEAMEFGPLPAKDEWALDGTMSGTGRAVRSGPGTGVSPTPPASAPMPPGTASPTSTPTSKRPSSVSRPTGLKTPTSWSSPLGRRRSSSTGWSTSCAPRACRSVVPAHHAVALPSVGLEEATRGKQHVLVYELNAGQMVDDVRMYAHDRSVIRSIGGVSQDESGMRQGDLFERRRGSSADTPRRGRAVAARN